MSLLDFSTRIPLGTFSILLKICFKFSSYDWLHYSCGEWEGWALINWFNHTSRVTAVTPTDRPKSVRNSCVIKVFGGVFMLSRCFLDCSVGVGVFVTGLSQISSFFYSNKRYNCLYTILCTSLMCCIHNNTAYCISGNSHMNSIFPEFITFLNSPRIKTANNAS